MRKIPKCTVNWFPKSDDFEKDAKVNSQKESKEQFWPFELTGIIDLNWFKLSLAKYSFPKFNVNSKTHILGNRITANWCKSSAQFQV